MCHTKVAHNLRPIPILMYHQIAPIPPGGISYPDSHVTPSAFNRQMALLARMGWRGLSMEALVPYLSGARTGKVVGITFDDGYLNTLENALPVLQRHHFSATCYVVGNHVGLTNAWDVSVGMLESKLMGADDLRHWMLAGQDVGSHTLTYRRLTQLSAAEAMEEIATSKQHTEKIIGREVRHFCYPYGDYTALHSEATRVAGYAKATAIRRGRCRLGIDLFELPRISVRHRTSLALFWLKICSGYDDRPHMSKWLSTWRY